MEFQFYFWWLGFFWGCKGGFGGESGNLGSLFSSKTRNTPLKKGSKVGQSGVKVGHLGAKVFRLGAEVFNLGAVFTGGVRVFGVSQLVESRGEIGTGIVDCPWDSAIRRPLVDLRRILNIC